MEIFKGNPNHPRWNNPHYGEFRHTDGTDRFYDYLFVGTVFAICLFFASFPAGYLLSESDWYYPFMVILAGSGTVLGIKLIGLLTYLITIYPQKEYP